MSNDLILLERAAENEHIALLTLNRPDVGNTLNASDG